MTADDFTERFVVPGLELLQSLGGPEVSPKALRLLVAIAVQETGLRSRYQKLANGRAGPARGWWQFERGGGVIGVMTHQSSRTQARALCAHLEINFQVLAVWRALEGNDLLAAGFARLLLWTDPKPLPEQRNPAWDYYLRNWRPGKPHREMWNLSWATACEVVPL